MALKNVRLLIGIIVIISSVAQCQEATLDGTQTISVGCSCDTRIYVPICGSDGQIYSNLCQFNCRRESLTGDQKESLTTMDSVYCRNNDQMSR